MDLCKLQDPIEAHLAILGFELLCLETAKEGGDSLVRLYIDHIDRARGGITLDDCVAVHENLVVWMDVEWPSLREELGIEVSSPGLERPLVKSAHFERFCGSLCRIQTRMPLNGQKRFKGWIVSADVEGVVIEEDASLKKIPFDMIQKARLAPFEESKAPKPKHAIRDAQNPEMAGAEKSVGEEA